MFSIYRMLLTLLTITLTIGSPLYEDELQIFDSVPRTPEGWRKGSRASLSQYIKLHLAIEQPRLDEFEHRLLNIAAPGHHLYGQHLSKQDLKSLLEPSVESSTVVQNWLDSYGIAQNDVVDYTDWKVLQVNISTAEKMLGTTFYEFKNQDTTVVRTLKYSVPRSLRNHIRMIQPTTRFGQRRSRYKSKSTVMRADVPVNATSFDPVRCNNTITPICLRTQYKINRFMANRFSNNKLGISGYLDQYARYSDLASFSNDFAPYARSYSSFTVEKINGGQNNETSALDSTEASLDVQYGTAMSTDTEVVYYSTAGRGPLKPDLDQPDQLSNENEPYLDQLLYLLDLPDEQLPSVLTTSYGEDEQSVPATYANVTCNLFAQLGARGVSVIFSSGDTGVGSGCQTNDGKNTTRFLPTFPASCPFVTSVGGTHNLGPERAVDFSSGGFSDLFPRPAYQEEAVCGYLGKLGDQWKGLYNPKGRGIPDVSARSVNFYIVDHGEISTVDGTSCSAPVFAGIVSTLNSLRLSLGLPRLGFLNPFLYKYGVAGLTDITEGGSTGCTGFDQFSGLPTPYVPFASWNATKGWDPVTGLGTPIFSKLVELMFKYAVAGNDTK